MERPNKLMRARSFWNALPEDDNGWKVMFTNEDVKTASADSFSVYLYGGKSIRNNSEGKPLYLLGVKANVANDSFIIQRYIMNNMDIKYIEVFGDSKIIAVYGDKI